MRPIRRRTPGEVVSCVGCHEPRSTGTGSTSAATRSVNSSDTSRSDAPRCESCTQVRTGLPRKHRRETFARTVSQRLARSCPPMESPGVVQQRTAPPGRVHAGSLEPQWQQGESLTIPLSPKVNLELVRIPAGEFEMGQADGRADECPAGQVKIARLFWMGRFEVTNEQYALPASGIAGPPPPEKRHLVNGGASWSTLSNISRSTRTSLGLRESSTYEGP